MEQSARPNNRAMRACATRNAASSKQLPPTTTTAVPAAPCTDGIGANASYDDIRGPRSRLKTCDARGSPTPSRASGKPSQGRRPLQCRARLRTSSAVASYRRVPAYLQQPCAGAWGPQWKPRWRPRRLRIDERPRPRHRLKFWSATCQYSYFMLAHFATTTAHTSPLSRCGERVPSGGMGAFSIWLPLSCLCRPTTEFSLKHRPAQQRSAGRTRPEPGAGGDRFPNDQDASGILPRFMMAAWASSGI